MHDTLFAKKLKFKERSSAKRSVKVALGVSPGFFFHLNSSTKS